MVSRSRLIAQAFGSGGKFRARYLESEWNPSTASDLVVSDNPPATPNNGELWYNSANAKLYVYYQDGTSNQWVVASPQLAGSPGEQGPAGSPTTVVATMAALNALTGMVAGDFALVTATNKAYMYNGSSWFLMATLSNESPARDYRRQCNIRISNRRHRHGNYSCFY